MYLVTYSLRDKDICVDGPYKTKELLIADAKGMAENDTGLIFSILVIDVDGSCDVEDLVLSQFSAETCPKCSGLMYVSSTGSDLVQICSDCAYLVSTEEKHRS